MRNIVIELKNPQEFRLFIMIFNTHRIREATKLGFPDTDFDSSFTFYYDETNNIRKFYLREDDFNYSFDGNFTLGGVVLEDEEPELDNLFDGLNLQENIDEVKFSHIAFGDFLSCLKSRKLNFFLNYLINNDIYIHYSSLNILFYSLADIVDSAIMNSEPAKNLGQKFAFLLKNDLYRLAKLEIDAFIELLYQYEYPNIKADSINEFINDLISLFDGYEDDPEFHVGLTSLKQILREADDELVFIMNEEDHILLEDLSHFYMRPIYLFKNSTHIFDEEDSIQQVLNDYELRDGDEVIDSYDFKDSEDYKLIQVSDIFIGLVGKLSVFINTTDLADIENTLNELNAIQEDNLKLFFQLIEASSNKNKAFIHQIDSPVEFSKRAQIDHFIKNVLN